MSGHRERPFFCTPVNEQVSIKLTSRHVGGFSGTSVPYVKCDQHECQYVDRNEPPCPLNVEMFSTDPPDPEDDDPGLR